MKKIQVFLLGVILTLTALWPFLATFYYAPMVISFGPYSLLIFPLAAALISIIILRLFSGAEMTLDTIIQKMDLEPLKQWLKKISGKGKVYRFLAYAPLRVVERINTERLKNFLAKLFKKGRWFALLGSAFLFCPFIIPVVAKSCLKNEKNVYLATIVLNVAMTFIWNCLYVAGWEVIKEIFKTKLSIGAWLF